MYGYYREMLPQSLLGVQGCNVLVVKCVYSCRCILNLVCWLEFQVFFPSFLTSPIYYKYLTELLNSVSESQSSQTLSASVGSEDDVRRPGTHTYENSHLVKTTFGSDLDLTEDPDALWQRPYAG